MDPKNYKTIEDFVKSFERVEEIIREKNPDCIIAPMMGAVPFIDVLNIINEDFPNEKVEYVPASARIHRVRKVLRNAFKSIIEDYTGNKEKCQFLSLDEVVSGNSLCRIYNQFDAARTDYANEKAVQTFKERADFKDENVKKFRDEVKESILYNSLGIVEKRDKARSPEYNELLKKGIVIPVDTDCIVTMDRVDFFPVHYRIGRDNEKEIYLPVVDSFNYSKEYVDFLMQVAGILGKDPSKITARNIGKIRDSYKRVPENLRKLN